MAELATLLKSLRKVRPEVAAEMEYQVDKNLVRSHPGFMDSSGLWYGGKMTTYLNEVTKNDSSQYAIAMMDPDELSKMIGRANMDDPGVRDRVLDLYNRATSGQEGLRSIVKLDGLVNEKGFIDVTRITPGSQETMEALRLLDRDRLPDMPPARIPVLVHASGASWATDPAPRLRYNGQTTGTLSMPKWDARRPPPITKTVADAMSPTFYTDQPKTRDAVQAKLAVLFDPVANAPHAQALMRADNSEFAFDVYKSNIQKQKAAPSHAISELKAYQAGLRSQVSELLDPIIKRYGRDYVRKLAGKDTLTMKLLGATGEGADDPIVFTRTERYSTVPAKPGEFSTALTSPRETAMHAGLPNTVKSFQGNGLLHDYRLAERELPNLQKGSAQYKQAHYAIRAYEEHKGRLHQALLGVFPEAQKQNVQLALFEAAKEAKANWLETRKPGQRADFYTASDALAFLTEAITKRVPTANANGKDINTIARSLKEALAVADDRGTTTKKFMLRNIKSPMFLIDTGGWGPDTTLNQLKNIPGFEKQAVRLLDSNMGIMEKSAEVQKLLESKGYDSVFYLNNSSEGTTLNKFASTPDGGSSPTGFSPSFMIWKEDQIVRLDDEKLFPVNRDDSLNKALAGLLIAPAATKEKKDGSTD